MFSQFSQRGHGCDPTSTPLVNTGRPSDHRHPRARPEYPRAVYRKQFSRNASDRISRGDAPSPGEWIPALSSECPPNPTSAGMTMVGCGGWGWRSYWGGVFRARMRDVPRWDEWIAALWGGSPPGPTSVKMTVSVALASREEQRVVMCVPTRCGLGEIDQGSMVTGAPGRRIGKSSSRSELARAMQPIVQSTSVPPPWMPMAPPSGVFQGGWVRRR